MSLKQVSCNDSQVANKTNIVYFSGQRLFARFFCAEKAGGETVEKSAYS